MPAKAARSVNSMTDSSREIDGSMLSSPAKKTGRG
jgi:hypothetical protein